MGRTYGTFFVSWLILWGLPDCFLGSSMGRVKREGLRAPPRLWREVLSLPPIAPNPSASKRLLSQTEMPQSQRFIHRPVIYWEA